MRTDSIFYRLFQVLPGILLELADRPASDADDYEFTSVEIKQLGFRLDGLLRPRSDTPGQPIYFAEVQFYRDEEFYFRFFGEIFLYLSQYKPKTQPWQAIVLYPTRRIEIENTLQYGELLESDRVQRVYLDELGETADSSLGLGIVKFVVAPEENARERLQRLISQTRENVENASLQRNVIELIEGIAIYKLPQLSRQEIEAMFGLSDLRETRFYQEALEEGRLESRQEALEEGRLEGRLEGLEEGRLEGLQEGRQEGRQEGHQEGLEEGFQRGEYRTKLTVVQQLLQIGMSLEQIAQVVELPLEEVERMAQEPQ